MSEYIIGIVKDVFIGIGKWILIGIVNSSYWLCLFCCIGALILYIAGMKKAGKYVPASIIIYFLLQAIKGAVI